MQNQLDQIKKISQEDPKLFIDIVDNLVAVIDLLLGIKDSPR